MKRWFYILLGGLGLSLAAGAVVAMVWFKPIGTNNAIILLISEVVLILLGVFLGTIGLINGRNAGELNISAYMKSPRRDYDVNGGEIHFRCPACQKPYRASPLLAGKSFTCRGCQKVFNVSPSNELPDELPGPMERRLLPAPG
jgi:hypothetical protein